VAASKLQARGRVAYRRLRPPLSPACSTRIKSESSGRVQLLDLHVRLGPKRWAAVLAAVRVVPATGRDTADYSPGGEPFDAHAPLSQKTALALSFDGARLAARDSGAVYVGAVTKANASVQTPVSLTGNGSINPGALQLWAMPITCSQRRPTRCTLGPDTARPARP
jgi:hypothetical protein